MAVGKRSGRSDDANDRRRSEDVNDEEDDDELDDEDDEEDESDDDDEESSSKKKGRTGRDERSATGRERRTRSADEEPVVRMSQRDLDLLVKNRVSRAVRSAERKADRAKAQSSGDIQKLYDDLKLDYDDLEPELEELREAVSTEVTRRIKRLPAELRDLMPANLSAAQKLDWLGRAEKRASTLTAKKTKSRDDDDEEAEDDEEDTKPRRPKPARRRGVDQDEVQRTISKEFQRSSRYAD